VSYATAFKLVAGIPLFLLPAGFWIVAWYHSNKNVGIAFGAAVAGMTLYSMGEAFQPSTGLDLSSSLIDGFYTQPLGFLLLLFWILVYLIPRQKTWQLALAAILLALTILANFFNAMTAIILIASILIWDLVRWLRARVQYQRKAARNTFLSHLVSPWLALGLVAFWVVPMLSTYQYLVTRPLIRPLTLLATKGIWGWYILAAIGMYLWWKNRSDRLGPYLTACLVFFLLIVFSGSLAPPWFPFQVFRFFSTVNFLLCIPVGISLAFGAKLYFQTKGSDTSQKIETRKFSETNTRRQLVISTLIAIGLVVIGLVMSTKKLTEAFVFYTPEGFNEIAPVLEFAKSHRDGRYLVEVRPTRLSLSPLPVRADSLALNAYLGSQGNQTVSIVYREASPNSSFFNAQLNAFSSYRENFGISSALLDDFDFLDQPLSQHLARLQFIGVRYLVVATSSFKDRLSQTTEIIHHYDVGDWTIFELPPSAAPQIRPLNYRPALVVSDFTTKLRRQNQIDFVRLAEEQFSDAWFDVLLVRSAESKLDHLADLENFGSLIIEKYQYQDEDKAFDLIKSFALTHPVILISSGDPLFSRIQSSLKDFPHAVVIDRPIEPQGEFIIEPEPSHNYNSSSIKKLWQSIRTILDKEKIPVPLTRIESQTSLTSIQLRPTENIGGHVPVLIPQTFYPKWNRTDGKPIYASTPFFTITFLDAPTELVFRRDRYDRLAIWCSLFTVLAVVVVVLGSALRASRRNSKSYPEAPTLSR
jgi:hypothetical protein